MKTLNKNAQAWVKALRSGDYPQTRATLQDEQGFCCLGVACDLYEQAGGSTSRDEQGYLIGGWLGDQPGVQEWFGLRTSNGLIGGNRSLAYLNDEGRTFSELADVIESQPEGLLEDV